MPDLCDQIEPGSELGLTPPALNANGSSDLPHSEHLAAHEELDPCRVIMIEDVVSFFLGESDTHLIFVTPVDIKFLFHVCDVAFNPGLLFCFAKLPRLMLLFFDRLEGERVVCEGILDVSEVRLIADYFFTASFLEQFGSESLALLIVSHSH